MTDTLQLTNVRSGMAGAYPWNTQISMPQSEQRPWMVIYDPSGDFTGGLFRAIDLEHSSTWDNGTIFWNIHTGQVRVWRHGKFDRLIPLEQKKPARKEQS